MRVCVCVCVIRERDGEGDREKFFTHLIRYGGASYSDVSAVLYNVCVRTCFLCVRATRRLKIYTHSRSPTRITLCCVSNTLLWFNIKKNGLYKSDKYFLSHKKSRRRFASLSVCKLRLLYYVIHTYTRLT